MSGGVFLLEVDAWTGAAVERFYLSSKSFSSGPSDTPPNKFFDGRIKDLGSMQRSLFADGATLGQASVNYGSIELVNADGALDNWLNYGFDGRRLAVMHLDGSNTTVFRGTVQNLETSNAQTTLRLKIKDRLAELDQPLLTTRYAGTTLSAGATAEGNENLKDTIKPYLFGATPNVPAKVVNSFNLLYQFAANAVSSIVLYEGGLPVTNVGNFGSIASLIDAPIAAGQYGTCVTQCMVRVGSIPEFDLTADVVEGATAADRTAAQIVLRILDLLGVDEDDIDTDSFTTLDTFNDAECNIYIDADTSALSLISDVLGSIGAEIAPSNTGIYQVVAFAAPTGTPVATFTLRDGLAEGETFGLATAPEQEGGGIPAWSVVLNWGRVWQTMSAGDLGGDPTSLTDPVGGVARRDFLSRETRQAIAQDTSVQTVHPLAAQITIDTLLTFQADAEAEAARRLALYKVRRDRLIWPVPFDDAREIELGDVVEIDIARFGYEGGKLFRVIGRTDDFTKRIISLDLWGGV